MVTTPNKALRQTTGYRTSCVFCKGAVFEFFPERPPVVARTLPGTLRLSLAARVRFIALSHIGDLV